MRKLLLSISLLIASIGSSLGQAVDQADEAHSWGKATFAPGVAACCGEAEPFFATGAAYEGRIAGNLGVTLGVGYNAPTADFGAGFGNFSPGVVYEFSSSRTRPYVTGGYSLLFRTSAENALFFGGGVNHWVGKRWGVGFEVRDQAVVGHDLHLIQFGGSLLFR